MSERKHTPRQPPSSARGVRMFKVSRPNFSGDSAVYALISEKFGDFVLPMKRKQKSFHNDARLTVGNGQGKSVLQGRPHTKALA